MPSACPRCGLPVPDGSQFCENCGAALAGSGPPTPGVPAVPVPAPPGPEVAPPAQPYPAAPPVPPPGGYPPVPPVPPSAGYPAAPSAAPVPPPVPGGYYPSSGAPGGPPGGGGYYPSPPAPTPPGRPRGRRNAVGIGAAVGGVLVLAVVVGLVVPKLISHNPTPTTVPNAAPGGSVTTTTSPPSPSTTAATPSTTLAQAGTTTSPPATFASPTTPPATGAPTTSPPASTTTAPATTTTTPGGSAGQTAHNSVASVALASGWSVGSSSSADDLFLNGPNGLAAEFVNAQVTSSVTVSQILQEQLAAAEKQYTNAEVCSQPQAGDVPGTPQVPGEGEILCFTVTPQNGSAVPYAEAIFDGLASTSSGQLAVIAFGYFPQSTTSTDVKQDLVPVLDSVHWLQVGS